MKNIRCFYCGVQTFAIVSKKNISSLKNLRTRDHLTPRSRGGGDIETNKVWACHKCNNEKGSLTFDEYRAVVALRKNLVTIPDMRIFPGERWWEPINISMGWGTKLEIFVDRAITVVLLFVLVKIVPIIARHTWA